MTTRITSFALAVGLTLATSIPASAWQQDGGYFQPENPPVDVSADAPNWAWFVPEEGDVVSTGVHAFVKASGVNANWMQVLPVVTTMNRHYGDANFDPNNIEVGQPVLFPVNVPAKPATNEASAATTVDDTDPNVIRSQLAAGNISEVLWGLAVPTVQGHRLQERSILSLEKSVAEQALWQATFDAWQKDMPTPEFIKGSFADLYDGVNANQVNIATQGERLGQLELNQLAPLSDVVGQFSQWLAATTVGEDLGIKAETLTNTWQQYWEMISFAAVTVMLAIFGVVGRGRIMHRIKKNRRADHIQIDDAFEALRQTVDTKIDQVTADQAITRQLAQSAATSAHAAHQRIDYVADAVAPAEFDWSVVSVDALKKLALGDSFTLLVVAKDGSDEWELTIRKTEHNFGDGKFAEAIAVDGLSKRADVYDPITPVKNFGDVARTIQKGIIQGRLSDDFKVAKPAPLETMAAE